MNRHLNTSKTISNFEIKSDESINYKKSTNIEASFTLFKVFFGMGILVLPSAFSDVGLGLGIVGITIVGIITYYCMRLIMSVADDINDDQIQLYDIGKLVLGDFGLYTIQTCLMLMQLGICIGILIFAHTLLQELMCTYNISSLCNSTFFYVIISLFVALPLSFITNVHYFYIPALCANIFIIIGMGALIYHDSQYLHDNPISGEILSSRFSTFQFSRLPLFFGIAVYSYEGIGVMFDIRSAMQKPKDFPKLVLFQFIIMTALYIAIPSLCYLTFGNQTNGIIFLNLPQTDAFFLTLEILYTIALLCSYPIQIYPAFKIIESSSVGNWIIFESGDSRYILWKRLGIRLLVVTLMFLVAYTTKSFSLFVNLLGSLVFTIISFAVPICIYNKYYESKISLSKKILNYAILASGLILGGFGVIVSISDLY